MFVNLIPFVAFKKIQIIIQMQTLKSSKQMVKLDKKNKHTWSNIISKFKNASKLSVAGRSVRNCSCRAVSVLMKCGGRLLNNASETSSSSPQTSESNNPESGESRPPGENGLPDKTAEASESMLVTSRISPVKPVSGRWLRERTWIVLLRKHTQAQELC